MYYYKIAQELQPYDSRMLIALGDTFEKVEQYSNALKCYQRAYNAGDIEGITLLRMGNLYEKLEDIESAVPIYIEYCKDERIVPDKASLCRAYITLGSYYERMGQYDEAAHYAYKCLEYDDVKAEAQELLDTIKNKRVFTQMFPAKADAKDAETPVASDAQANKPMDFSPTYDLADDFTGDMVFGSGSSANQENTGGAEVNQENRIEGRQEDQASGAADDTLGDSDLDISNF